MKSTTFLLISLILFCIATDMVIGQTFSIQGVLRDPLGRTVEDGSYSLTFRIYNVATGGAALWSETQGSVDVKHGMFAVELGTVTPMTNLTFSTQYYIGISVQGGQELEPRIKMTNSPSAYGVFGVKNTFPSVGNVGVGIAAPLAGLHIKTHNAADNLLKIESLNTGGSVLTVDASGKLGLNVTPEQALDINGNLKMRNGSILFDDGSSLSSAYFGGSASSLTNDGNVIITTDADDNGSGEVQVLSGANTVFTVANSGNVGIGTTSPNTKLDVIGDMKVTGNTTVTGEMNTTNRIKDKTGYLAPVGSITMFAGSTAPEGWLICDGSGVSSATYQDLYSVIGTVYGGSSSNFNLPNLKGRVPVGRDASDASFNDLNEKGGAKTHPLITAEMPSHYHTVDPPNTNTNTTGEHSHTLSVNMKGNPDGWSDYGRNYWSNNWDSNDPETSDDGDHSHNVDIAKFNSGSTGSGVAHNNLQPYIVLNYIIKY